MDGVIKFCLYSIQSQTSPLLAFIQVLVVFEQFGLGDN